jgi:hypothetical protein
MVKLGIANSRMKDFYDLWKLSRDFPFDGPLLSEAMRKTFARRETELPTGKLPIVFREEFHQDEIKNKQWNAFCQKNRRYIGELRLEEVCIAIRAFLGTIVDRGPCTKRFASEALESFWALEINHRGFVFRRHRCPPPSVRIPAVASNAHCVVRGIAFVNSHHEAVLQERYLRVSIPPGGSRDALSQGIAQPEPLPRQGYS